MLMCYAPMHHAGVTAAPLPPVGLWGGLDLEALDVEASLVGGTEAAEGEGCRAQGGKQGDEDDVVLCCRELEGRLHLVGGTEAAEGGRGLLARERESQDQCLECCLGGGVRSHLPSSSVCPAWETKN